MNYQVKYEDIRIGDFAYRIRSLKDRQQYSDPEGLAEQAGISSATWPLFGLIWPSAVILAEIMNEYPLEGLKILEVGCGLALASLVAHHRGADITASDYHPLVPAFLEENIALNNFLPIRYAAADWGKTGRIGKFNLIIGSDLLYEPDHPAMLSAFINRNASDAAVVIIIDPGRKLQGKFTRMMTELGFSCTSKATATQAVQGNPYKGKIMVYTRKSREFTELENRRDSCPGSDNLQSA